MERRRLGSGGPELSVIGFGAWEAGGADWGPNESEEAVIDAIRAGIDAGMNWIDTAEVYGKGVSERLVGRAIADRRDHVLVATKVAPAPGGTGFAPERVAEACAASMRRLGVDRIDLYQLHWPDETGVPVEETWDAMAKLVDDGSVGAIGVSNFDRALIERCEAVRHVDSLQQEFSMLRLDDRDLIAWCGTQGTGVVTYAPLASGVLTGAVTMETTFGRGDWRGGGRWDAEEFEAAALHARLALVDALRPVAERLGWSLAQLSLAWNWQQPGVTSAIAGSRDAGHVRSNATAGALILDDATRTELDALLRDAPEGLSRRS
jgi:aryl-alcohol dehydrogenase-like predicted oxidoreductase